jgi:sulfoxide reductase catalytic subunit YedY
MTLIRIIPSWEISENQITPESVFINRRRFMKNLIGAGLTASALSLVGCQATSKTQNNSAQGISDFKTNPNFAQVNRPVTAEDLATKYNNFYEYGGTKSIWQAAQALPLEDWKVEVSGLVKNPTTYTLDDLQKKFPLEERIYRFRCVEAWAMVVPWLGFPMRALMAAVEPNSEAKFVRFTSFYDPKITTGPGFWANGYPWPYTEGLRIEEMANDLAFFCRRNVWENPPETKWRSFADGAPLEIWI